MKGDRNGKNKESSGTAAKIAKLLRTFCIIGMIFSVVGAVLGFTMQENIARYYIDADNVMAARGSLDADMGIFSFLPFDSLKAAGNYGAFFALQLICLAVIFCVHIYLFTVLRTAMENIRDSGRAYPAEDAGKTKKSFIAVTIIILLFSGLIEAAVTGILLCGLYNVTAARDCEAE